MKSNWLGFAGSVSLALFAAAVMPGCGGSYEDEMISSDDTASGDLGSDENASMDEGDYGTAEQALTSCTNASGSTRGVASVMGAFAVAVAQDLGRWNASKDFIQNNTSGLSEASAGAKQAIKLASGSDANGPIGKSRCADGKCAKVQALLDMQYDQANNKVYVQGPSSTKTLLSPAALRWQMFNMWGHQKSCDANARNGDLTACTTEKHALKFVSAAPGGCDTNFTFSAKAPTGAALQYIDQLKNELTFADPTNPYIAFTNLGNGYVSIDPTYGLNDNGITSTGSCTAACTKISLTSVAGKCCSCGGVNKTFAKSTWNATTFLCQ
jgi:hypothetical protein